MCPGAYLQSDFFAADLTCLAFDVVVFLVVLLWLPLCVVAIQLSPYPAD